MLLYQLFHLQEVKAYIFNVYSLRVPDRSHFISISPFRIPSDSCCIVCCLE